MGRERPEFAPSLRSVLVWSYVIFYTADAVEIVIMRLVDGRIDIDKEFQDWPLP
jgi:plasmid stabilization system protein ParE